jgi:hypothetical protein
MTLEISPIIWYQPYNREGFTFYPAIIRTGFGNYFVAWKVAPDGLRILVTSESASAELPPNEIPLLLHRDMNSGLTTIYRKLSPPGASLSTPLFKTIAIVRTIDLESVFA